VLDEPARLAETPKRFGISSPSAARKILAKGDLFMRGTAGYYLRVFLGEGVLSD
jgi:hypothetical protein